VTIERIAAAATTSISAVRDTGGMRGVIAQPPRPRWQRSTIPSGPSGTRNSIGAETPGARRSRGGSHMIGAQRGMK
jgi:hypothetical protein